MENNNKILIFSIDGKQFGVNIMEVERILPYTTPTTVPDTPDFFEGVINYEGGILPVIDVEKKFSLIRENEFESMKIIVSNQDECKYGLKVDLVQEVVDVSLEQIEETPEIIGGITKRYLKGLIKIDGRIVMLLDIYSILTDEEKKII